MAIYSYPNSVKTASQLKYWYEENYPGGKFFTRPNMRFAGDTMANFGVRTVRLRRKWGDDAGKEFDGFELYRRRPVKMGNKRSFFFDAQCRLAHNAELVNAD